MESKFKVGQRVICFGTHEGTVARVEFRVCGYFYWVDLDSVGCKIVSWTSIKEISK